MSITAEDLARRFGGTVAPKSPATAAFASTAQQPPQQPAQQGPTPEDLAKQFGGTVAPATPRPSGTPATAKPATTPAAPTKTTPEQDTGIWAGIKRGLSNLNPINFINERLDTFERNMPGPARDKYLAEQQKLFEAWQRGEIKSGIEEHPIATALDQVPVVGPMLSSFAERLPRDPSGAIAEGVTTIGGGYAAGKAIQKAPEAFKAVRDVPGEYIPDRLVSSLLKPDKAAFDLGADPVQATLKSNAWGTTLGDFKRSLQSKMAAAETSLLRAATGSLGRRTNMSDIFKSQMLPEIRQAMLDGNKTMVNRLVRITDNRIADIQRRYGTTDLNALQILKEKRLLKNEIKFTTDEAQLNINRAKMNLYRGMDSALDNMVPGVKDLNRHYSGLIEADKLVDKRIFDMRKSDILPTTDIWKLPLESLSKFAPTFLKTTTAQFLRSRGKNPISMPEPIPQKLLSGDVMKDTTVNVTGTIQRPSGRVYEMPESSITKDARFNRALTTGQKALPEPGKTSIKVTPQPPESFSEAMKRTETAQSRLMRETMGKGPFDKQARPATADEYLRTKGGTDMPNPPKFESKSKDDASRRKPPAPEPPKKGKRK